MERMESDARWQELAAVREADRAAVQPACEGHSVSGAARLLVVEPALWQEGQRVRQRHEELRIGVLEPEWPDRRPLEPLAVGVAEVGDQAAHVRP